MPINCCVPLCKLNAPRRPELSYHSCRRKKTSGMPGCRTFPDKGVTRAAKLQSHCVFASLHRRRLRGRNETHVAASNSRDDSVSILPNLHLVPKSTELCFVSHVMHARKREFQGNHAALASDGKKSNTPSSRRTRG